MIRTLRLKFICVTMAIFTVFLAVLLYLLVHTTAEGLRSESITQLRQAADEPIFTGRPGQARLSCFVIRVTPRGQSVQSDGSFDLSDEAMLADIMAQAAASEDEVGELEEYSLRFCRQQRPSELTIAFADISGEMSTLKTLRLTCTGIGIVSVLVFWLLSILLARWAVRPVERAWQEQRQFVADASHELKTPLTVIMTNAELIQGQEDERQSQYAHSILTMSRQMRSLVESLLELARVDNGAARAAFEPVDLSELVNDELLPFEPLYFERGLALESQVEADITITGSPRHLRQVADILLDNAMKYTPSGSTVRVCLARQGSHALLTVANPGEPLSKEECQQIFRRFYRVDAARTSGGYGLGLPIAKGIITDHGGKVWAESRDGLVIFRVQLPIK